MCADFGHFCPTEIQSVHSVHHSVHSVHSVHSAHEPRLRDPGCWGLVATSFKANPRTLSFVVSDGDRRRPRNDRPNSANKARSSGDDDSMLALLALSTAMAPRIVVLGGSGFIGSEVCKALIGRGCAVTSVSRSGMKTRGALRLDGSQPTVLQHGETCPLPVPEFASWLLSLGLRERPQAAQHSQDLRICPLAAQPLPQAYHGDARACLEASARCIAHIGARALPGRGMGRPGRVDRRGCCRRGPAGRGIRWRRGRRCGLPRFAA